MLSSIVTTRLSVLLLPVLLAAATCRPEDSRSGTPTSVSPSAASEEAITPVGPFVGETWPAGTINSNVLLHDDGHRLLEVSLGGGQERVWRHPRAYVAHIAASPGGDEIAMSVALQPNRGGEPSFVLYLLRADGTIQTVDVVSQFTSIDSPIFLTPPTDRDAGTKLYWLRVGDQVDRYGRLDTQVMVMSDEGVREVEVPLRYAESPFDIHGYPGAYVFSLSLFRQNDVPTRLEILRNDDFSRSTDASLTLWGNNEFRANTDVFVGVAWPTPIDYVVPVANEANREDYQLRLFRSGCEYLGYRVVYEGQNIDWGYAELPWRILPGGSNQVLVLGKDDVTRVAHHEIDAAPWLAVGLSTGRIRPTDAMWEPGAWTWVSKAMKRYPSPRNSVCGGSWEWD